MHDFLTVGAPAPLQEACAVGIRELGPSYYEEMASDYKERRDIFLSSLKDSGFKFSTPEGAYYVLADFSNLSSDDDTTFSKNLAQEGGVAPVPGSSFFSVPERGHSVVRFAFCKRIQTLQAAGERLKAFASNHQG